VTVSSFTQPPLARLLLAELLGTALLVTGVVGSGIPAQQLSPGAVGLPLLENSTATALGLTVLILMFGLVSGAHFNPEVSLADWFLGRRTNQGLRLDELIDSPRPCPSGCSGSCTTPGSPSRSSERSATTSGHASPPGCATSSADPDASSNPGELP